MRSTRVSSAVRLLMISGRYSRGGLERIKSYVGGGPVSDRMATDTQISARISSLGRPRISGRILPGSVIKNMMVKLWSIMTHGLLNPRRPGNDTEAQTLWSLFEAMAAVPTLLVRRAD